MELFRRIFFAAVLAGTVAGLVNAGLQQWRVVPLILQAETFETGGHSHGAAAEPEVEEHVHEDGTVHLHEVETETEQTAEAEEWAPADGWERTGFTILATLLAGVGFTLVIAAVSMLTGLAVTPVNGMLWGLAGFAAFNLAPAMGLPPELPGMAAADLATRQIWWWGTALATGLGAYVIAQFRTAWAIGAACVLWLAPHIIGAPVAPAEHSDVPAHLATAFAANALGAALIFWLISGSAYGWLTQYFSGERK